jgi:methyl-accepting chemotaxis protein
MSFNTLRLRTKIMLGIGVPLVLALVIGVISIININSMIATSQWVDHTYKVLGQAEHIIASAVDMETGVRGFALAGQEEFLEPYQQGEKWTYEAITSLQQTVSDNPDQVERLAEVEKILQEWQREVTEPEIALRREIGDAETMNDMAKLVQEGEGKMYFDRFRAQMASFIANEQQLVNEHQQALEKATAATVVNRELVSETSSRVDQANEVIALANRVLLAALNMETGVRGFLLAGREEFLEPYNTNRVTWRNAGYARRMAGASCQSAN